MQDSMLNLNMLYIAACKCCVVLLLLSVANVLCYQLSVHRRTALQTGEDRNETYNDTYLTEAGQVKDTVCKDSQLTVQASQLLECVLTSWTFECDSSELTGFVITYHFNGSQCGQTQLLEPRLRRLEVSMEGRELPSKVCVHAMSKGGEIKYECGVPYVENVAVLVCIGVAILLASLSVPVMLCICCSDDSYGLIEMHDLILEKEMERHVLDKIYAGKTGDVGLIKAMKKYVLDKIKAGKTCDAGLIKAMEMYVIDMTKAGKAYDVGLKEALEMYVIDMNKKCAGLNNPNGYDTALYSHDQRDKSHGGKDVLRRADQIAENCHPVASSLNGHGVLKVEESSQQVEAATLKQEVATTEYGQENRPGQDIDVSSKKADVNITRL